MGQIAFPNGLVALFEDADADLILPHRWYVSSKKYAFAHFTVGGVRSKMAWMHRLVMDAPPRTIVDHINRNPLDNRRSNLRFVSASESMVNRGFPKHSSQYRGVTYAKANGKWQASATKERRTQYLGQFVNEQDAARAYDAAARKLFGEFAILNFPDGEQ